MKNLQTPKEWRTGQTIFNFLEWLANKKGYDTKQSVRMADPFHLSDKDLEKLFEEYLSSQL